MKALILISILSLMSFSALAASPIVGNYKCQRSDNKSAPLTVSATGETFTFQWTNDKGYPIMYGTGVMTKGMNNVASVVFWDTKDNSNYGNELFEVKSDGSLEGTFTMQSDDKVGQETCTKS